MRTSVVVVDAGGVLLTEPVPDLLAAMAVSGGTSPAEVAACFERELYVPLWSGQLPLSGLWARLRAVSGARHDDQYWEDFFLDRLRRSSALGRLDELRSADSVVVLSNHLSRWLRPHLREAIDEGLLDHVLISEETGHVKPAPEAFLDVLRLPEVGGEPRVLMVDDRPQNLSAARAAGFDTIEGSTNGKWLESAVRWLAVRDPERLRS